MPAKYMSVAVCRSRKADVIRHTRPTVPAVWENVRRTVMVGSSHFVHRSVATGMTSAYFGAQPLAKPILQPAKLLIG